jgi:hypothetical protein
MSNVIDETGGILSQMAIEDGVASKRADELLRKYEANGIDGLFNSFGDKKDERELEPVLIEATRLNGSTTYFDFKI